MKKRYRPTDAELEILNILWKDGPQSVRSVHEELTKKKEIYYTTTLKTMQVMYEKGLLDRDTSSRSHIYSPKVLQENIKESIINKIKETVFGGSTGQLIISAIGSSKPTPEELEEIESLINQLKEGND